jgi:four helix bundle protein
VSVPSSISEGAGRANKKEFAQFLYIALGSLAELETQLLIAVDLGYVEGGSPTLERLGVVRKLIIGLIYSLKKNVTSV